MTDEETPFDPTKPLYYEGADDPPEFDPTKPVFEAEPEPAPVLADGTVSEPEPLPPIAYVPGTNVPMAPYDAEPEAEPDGGEPENVPADPTDAPAGTPPEPLLGIPQDFPPTL